MTSAIPVIAYVGPDAGWEAIAALFGGRARLVRSDPNQEALGNALREADGLVDAAIRVPLTDAMVVAAPRLRIVSCASTGADHVARHELTKRGGVVRTLGDSPEVIHDLTPAAEFSWALLLACARKLPSAVAHVKKGSWDREKFPGLMLNGRALGLIGCGRIGSWMARYARAFNMRLEGHDPHLAVMPQGVRRVPLPELMATSDAVSVHVPLTPETRGLVSAELLALIKPGAIFVNTSRGAVVDEGALLAGLKSGRIGAAGLDVLDGEPVISNHPLLGYAQTHDNLLITPHCGGFSPDAVARVAGHAAGVALEFLGRNQRP